MLVLVMGRFGGCDFVGFTVEVLVAGSYGVSQVGETGQLENVDASYAVVNSATLDGWKVQNNGGHVVHPGGAGRGILGTGIAVCAGVGAGSSKLGTVGLN